MEFERKQIMIPRPKCFCCKSSIDVKRNEVPALLYYNDHYYHEKCFIEMRGIKKRCYRCKKDIIITDSSVECVKYDDHYYHTSCFGDWCNEKKTPKRKAAYTHFNQYIEEASAAINELLENKKIDSASIQKYKDDAQKQINRWFAESDVNSFLKEEYDIVKLPWTKIPQVYNGTYPNLEIPIPAEDLLDMWIQKMPFLRKQNDKLQSRSKDKISAERLIHYDLAILVSKYDDYLKWKEKQRFLSAEEDKPTKNQNEISIIISELSRAKRDERDNNDELEDLVDEIFNS